MNDTREYFEWIKIKYNHEIKSAIRKKDAGHLYNAESYLKQLEGYLIAYNTYFTNASHTDGESKEKLINEIKNFINTDT